ncbi:MAG: hypothetical protein M1823_006147 [Watsoniomyces obsoletus]|nr:MAG: hypothetical protein M1823_006147 [Watsoniomyces obsoletus]
MPVLQAVFTLADRLKSFAGARLALVRGSMMKSPKILKWPHQKPSAEQLADAGFYYTPIRGFPDNVTCFMCKKSLDGWEPHDDPALEHLTHSRDCPWAMLACASKADDLPHDLYEDPVGEAMAEARRATFADRWPHEGKKGWTCKTEKMVDGGWHYSPTPESDDFVTCAYCHLALDGWEPKDKPLEEHRRRSPGCPFIELRSKPKRGARSSKASRVSAQSAISAQEDLTMATTNTSMVSKTGKKTGRAKKTTTSSKTAANKKKINTEPMASNAKSIEQVPEPEDSGFEVLVEQPVPASRGRKRKTDDMESKPAQRASKRITTGTRGNLLKTPVQAEGSDDAPALATGSDPDPPTQLVFKKQKQRDTAGDVKKAADMKKTVEAKVVAPVAVPVAAPVAAPVPTRRSLRGLAARNSNASTVASMNPTKVRPESVRASWQQMSPSPLPKKAIGGRKAPPPAKKGKKGSKQAEPEMEPVPQLMETTSRSPSVQSSDAENHPPSSRRDVSGHHDNSDHTVIITRSALQVISPSKQNTQGMMYGNGKRGGRGQLQTNKPWTAVDLDTVFIAGEDDQENVDIVMEDVLMTGDGKLSSPEKNMSVEAWIRRNAAMAETRLRRECDRMVSMFEREGNRALQTLEGLMVID